MLSVSNGYPHGTAVTRLVGLSYEARWHRSRMCLRGPFTTSGKQSRCYVYLKHTQVVGVVQFDLDTTARGRNYITGTFTYVRPAYRKRGIAKEIWRAILDELNPWAVQIHVVSSAGLTLFNSLEQEYPTVSWDICPDGRLTNLKKRKKSA